MNELIKQMKHLPIKNIWTLTCNLSQCFLCAPFQFINSLLHITFQIPIWILWCYVSKRILHAQYNVEGLIDSLSHQKYKQEILKLATPKSHLHFLWLCSIGTNWVFKLRKRHWSQLATSKLLIMGKVVSELHGWKLTASKRTHSCDFFYKIINSHSIKK